ncbi:TRAP transporter substrate-binding protein DctP [Chloroflexota bacterium]
MKKKILLIPLALILIISLVACAAPAPAPAPAPTTTVTAPAPTATATTTTTTTATATVTKTAEAPKLDYNWRYAGVAAPDMPSSARDEAYCERVLELSDNRIQIDPFTGNALGDWISTFEEVMRGTIEISKTCLATKFDPRIDVVYIPTLVSTWEEAKIAYTPGGFVYDTAREIGLDLGYETLGCDGLGFIGMATSKPVPSPGDPDVPKGLKIRTWAAKSPELILKRFGYTATVLPWNDVFSGMQTGIIDGEIGADAVSTHDWLRDVVKYYLPVNVLFEGHFYLVNLELWNSLSIEDQGILRKAALEGQDKSFAETEQDELDYMQKMRDYGIEVIEFTADERAAMKQACIDDVWPELYGSIGKKIIDDAVAWVATLK